MNQVAYRRIFHGLFWTSLIVTAYLAACALEWMSVFDWLGLVLMTYVMVAAVTMAAMLRSPK